MGNQNPPFDPSLVGPLKEVENLFGPFTLDRLETVRQIELDAAPSDEVLGREGRLTVKRRSIPGAPGGPEIELLILSPVGVDSPLPALYNLHSGGMILGDNRTDMEYVSSLVEEAGVIAISPEYRLAPEHPHPAPIEDCFTALCWVADHAEELGVDPDRLIVSGISAGGGLAAALALKARDEGGPDLRAQMLICPMLDDRFETPSSLSLQGQGVWDVTANRTGWTALLGSSRGGAEVSPYAAPARAGDPRGLPPAFLDAGSVELFRDEIVTYAGGIWQAGGSAELHVWPGGFHGFDLVAPDAPLSRAARSARLDWLRRQL
jgi:acetyl esterase/lipase